VLTVRAISVLSVVNLKNCYKDFD